MSVMVILLLASLAVALAFLVAFVWAVRAGQFEDTATPALRVLTEERAASDSNSAGVPRPALARKQESRNEVATHESHDAGNGHGSGFPGPPLSRWEGPRETARAGGSDCSAGGPSARSRFGNSHTVPDASGLNPNISANL